MKVIVKFSAIKNDTFKKIFFEKEFESSTDFVDIPMPFNGIDFVNTAFYQADEWISSLDKKYIIEDKDLLNILNWEVISVGDKVKKAKKSSTSVAKISKEEQVLMIVNECFADSNIKDRITLDFVVCYKELHDSIKNLNPEQQISIVLKSMNIGYTASTASYDHIVEYGKLLDQLTLDELRSKEHWSIEELQVYLEDRKKMITR